MDACFLCLANYFRLLSGMVGRMLNVLNPLELLVSIFYPKTCANCSQWLVQGEEGLCLHCLDGLPRTGFFLQSSNPVEKIFWGRSKILFASSFMHFSDHGTTQKLLHDIKYHGKK